MTETAEIHAAEAKTNPPEQATSTRKLAIWSGVAAFSLTALLLSAQTDAGIERIQQAINALSPPSQEIVTAKIAPQLNAAEREIASLSQTVRVLAADRERLTERVASLERTLDDVTGSIKKQAEAATVRPKIEPAPIKEAPPVIAAPVTAPSKPEPPKSPPPEAAAQPAPGTIMPAPVTEVPLPPEAPVRVATAQPSAPPAELPRNTIGIDLGGATSAELLRARWLAIKANYGPMLGPLKPMMSMHERKPGVVSYRLVVGPIASETAATALCAKLIAARALCRPTFYNSGAAAAL